jgi:hypothetical protein
MNKKTKKPIKILKKPTGSVRFRFYKFETKKTKSKPKKPSQTGLNWFFIQKTELKISLVIIFYKN